MLYVHSLHNRPDFVNDVYIDELMTFVTKYLGFDGMVYIQYKENLGACGFADRDDEYDEYMVEINNELSEEEFRATLFHEMVHVDQMARGDLQSCEMTGVPLWRGHSYDEAYAETPWEIEAYEMEDKMMKEYDGH